MSGPPDAPIPAADRNGQLIVACGIVGMLGLVAVSLIIGGVVLILEIGDKNLALVVGIVGTALTTVGVIVGALASALNAPTGIANVIRAAGSASPPPP